MSGDLIPIDETKQTVNARDLWEFLESKTRFNDWIANRVRDFGFLEDQDFVTVTENLVSGGCRKEYHVSLDMAKELSMVERNEKGKQARKYFIECEKRMKECSLVSRDSKLDAAIFMLTELQIETKNEIKALRVETRSGFDELKQNQSLLESRVYQIEDWRRRPFSAATKTKWGFVLCQYYSGKCPNCEQETIFAAEKYRGVEFDHFNSKSANKISDGWPICKGCHAAITHGSGRTNDVRGAFDHFQRRVSIFLRKREGKQLGLFE